jgi:uncharacterized membrane protein YqjE
MASHERSLSEVLQDVIRNVQEIVRAEVRLAKTEIQEEAARAKASGLMLGVGVVSALFAVFFLLLSIVYALTLIMPNWAAALIVGGVLAGGAGLMLTIGVKEFKLIHPTPERTLETIRENVEWAKQHSK